MQIFLQTAAKKICVEGLGSRLALHYTVVATSMQLPPAAALHLLSPPLPSPPLPSPPLPSPPLPLPLPSLRFSSLCLSPTARPVASGWSSSPSSFTLHRTVHPWHQTSGWQTGATQMEIPPPQRQRVTNQMDQICKLTDFMAHVQCLSLVYSQLSM